jgi:phosphatidate cytidylyltransferase
MAQSSLFQRVATALALAPVVIAGVLLLPTFYLSMLFGLIVLIGGWEWTRLVGIFAWPGRVIYLLLLASLFWLVAELLTYSDYIAWFFAGVVLWWSLVSITLVRIKQIESAPPRFNLFGAVAGFFILVPAWAAIHTIHSSGESGPILTLCLLLLIWLADIGAYFAGHRWGQTKLSPIISPGKTREGVYGAMASAVVCAFALCWWLGEWPRLHWLVLLCLATVLLSVVGDLFESLFKRKAGVKDSGTILPGHGGVLDRIDSVTAAAPLFLLGLVLLEMQG